MRFVDLVNLDSRRKQNGEGGGGREDGDEKSGAPFTPSTQVRAYLKLATCIKYSEKARRNVRKVSQTFKSLSFC